MAQNKSQSKLVLSTNNLIAASVIGSLASILVSALLIKTLAGSIGLNGRIISKKNVANKQLDANIVAVQSLAKAYGQLGSKVQLVNDALPTTADFPGIVAFTEVLAGSSGVRLKYVTTAAASGGAAPVTAAVSANAGSAAGVSPGPLPIVFNVSVVGSYDNALRFLSNLELSSRPVKVLSVVQTGSSTEQTMDLKLQTYYQSPVDTSLKTEVVQ